MKVVKFEIFNFRTKFQSITRFQFFININYTIHNCSLHRLWRTVFFSRVGISTSGVGMPIGFGVSDISDKPLEKKIKQKYDSPVSIQNSNRYLMYKSRQLLSNTETQ